MFQRKLVKMEHMAIFMTLSILIQIKVQAIESFIIINFRM